MSDFVDVLDKVMGCLCIILTLNHSNVTWVQMEWDEIKASMLSFPLAGIDKAYCRISAHSLCRAFLLANRVHEMIAVLNVNKKIDSIRKLVIEHGYQYAEAKLKRNLDLHQGSLAVLEGAMDHTVKIYHPVDVKSLATGQQEQVLAASAALMVNMVADFPHIGGATCPSVENILGMMPETWKHFDPHLLALAAHFRTDVMSANIVACVMEALAPLRDLGCITEEALLSAVQAVAKVCDKCSNAFAYGLTLNCCV
jgi:hypothetical protein